MVVLALGNNRDPLLTHRLDLLRTPLDGRRGRIHSPLKSGIYWTVLKKECPKTCLSRYWVPCLLTLTDDWVTLQKYMCHRVYVKYEIRHDSIKLLDLFIPETPSKILGSFIVKLNNGRKYYKYSITKGFLDLQRVMHKRRFNLWQERNNIKETGLSKTSVKLWLRI